MAKPTKVAVIGVGYLGKIHAKIYAGMAKADLVAVVDSNPISAKEVATAHGCQAFPSAEALLAADSTVRPEAVSIVVPTSVHTAAAQPFLERGIHMLLEKPVAPTVAESERIVAMARKGKAILQVGHLERFNAGVMKLAELAKNPRFIEVHRLGTFTERATDVDVVTDLMIHDIDIVLSLVPAKLKRISATGSNVITNLVDIANARLEFDNGTVANVTASRVSRNQFRRIRVFAKDQYLGLNFTDQQIDEVRTAKGAEGANFPSLTERRIEVEPQLPLDAELAHFIDCVQNHKTPLVTGEAGLTAVRVAAQVKQHIAESMAH